MRFSDQNSIPVKNADDKPILKTINYRLNPMKNRDRPIIGETDCPICCRFYVGLIENADVKNADENPI